MDINKAKLAPIHIKILDFFHENPSCIDTVVGIALWTNENMKNVKKAVEDLANLKVLIVHKTPSTVGYSYTQDSAISKKVEKILRTTKNKKS